MKTSAFLKAALAGGVSVLALAAPALADEFDIPSGDLGAALFATVGILASLYKRTQNAQGGRVDIGCQVEERGVAFMVRDTGIGISATDIETALAPFGQIDSHLARRFDGTGLGLPIVRGICELHGGTLMIDSEVGKGTAVTAIFPDQLAARIDNDSAMQKRSPATSIPAVSDMGWSDSQTRSGTGSARMPMA